MKFILLHEGKNDDGIKSFFFDVWELYVKVGASRYRCCDLAHWLHADYAEPLPHCANYDKEPGV